MKKESSVLDHTGRPMQHGGSVGYQSGFSSQPYRGASAGQDLSGWNPRLASADAEYLPDRDTIVARARDVARNDGWASGAVQRQVDQTIGSDFRLSAKPDWFALGQTPEWAHEWSRLVESAWRNYANDPRFLIDASGVNNISGLFGLAFRERIVSGAALALIHWLPNRNSDFATAVEMVDTDRLSNPDNKMNDDHLRGGVELGNFSDPVAYHIRQTHPCDVGFTSQQFSWTRVPRKTAHGRSRVVYFYERDRPGETLGKSLMTPILDKFKMLDQYERTEMQAALVNAMFSTFVKSPMDSEFMEAITGGGSTAEIGSFQTARGEFHNETPLFMDGVKIPSLFPGDEIGTTEASHPNSVFPDFQRTALRYMASAFGQSYEQFAQDWSSTNYSSARASLLESWKFLLSRRGAFVAGFANQIYLPWLEEAMDKGIVPTPPGAPKFWDTPAAWGRATWIGPGRGWVDPVKEANASKIRMDNNISTLQDEAAAQGLDYQDVLAQRARENKEMEELGLTPSAPAPAPTPAPTPADDQDDDDDQDRADDEERRVQSNA